MPHTVYVISTNGRNLVGLLRKGFLATLEMTTHLKVPGGGNKIPKKAHPQGVGNHALLMKFIMS